jgi:ABC-type branched-subunit amino acid transport system substrate-binding protein
MAFIVVVCVSSHSLAQTPGVTETTIKIGNTGPYSGPASSNSVIPRTLTAFFKMVNDKGGVHGRQIEFISYDDAFSPPKTVEQTRKLVESDEVAFVFGQIGTAPNTAIQKYLNARGVPQLFIGSSAEKFNDPKNFPWTIALPWQPTYADEARFYVDQINKENPNAKIAIIYQNDDAGKEFLKATRDGLGESAEKRIAAAVPFELVSPTVDSQIAQLAATKADVLMIYAVIPRPCAQIIRAAHEQNWHPIRYLAGSCNSVETTLKPAGLEKAKGLRSLVSTHTRFDNSIIDEDVRTYLSFMKTYAPDIEPGSFAYYGYTLGNALVTVLKECGREHAPGY